MLSYRQKQRENKKFSKAVQAERQKEKVQQKKANISDITKLRKQRQKQASLHWPEPCCTNVHNLVRHLHCCNTNCSTFESTVHLGNLSVASVLFIP